MFHTLAVEYMGMFYDILNITLGFDVECLAARSSLVVN